MDQKTALKGLRIIYPAWMVLGIFSMLYIPSKFIADDAGETARRIMDNEQLFRFGIAAGLLTQLFFIFTVILLYHFFNNVSRMCVMNLMVFALVSVPIAMVSALGYISALKLAPDNSSLMMVFLDLNAKGTIIASIFWGLWLLPLGNLVRQSGYFPKFLAPALFIGGAGYFFGAFAQLLLADPDKIMPLFDLMTLGEIVFILWLVLRGAKLPDERGK
jgi:hypothetical protein